MLNQLSNWFAALLIATANLFASIPGGHLSVPDLKTANTASEPEAHFPIKISTHGNKGAEAHLFTFQAGPESRPIRWLFDTGSPFLYRNQLQPYLRTHGINQIDALILSHGDQNHIGAAPAILRWFEPEQLFESPLKNRSRSYSEINRIADEKKLGRIFLKRNDSLRFDEDTKLKVLFPPSGFSAQPRADDHCLVLRLEHHHWRILWTFDSGFNTEKWLLENQADLRADVWIKGRNIETPSGLIELVDRIQPKVIIATNADFPIPEKIPADWRNEITKRGIQLIELDTAGEVDLKANDETLRLTPFSEPEKAIQIFEETPKVGRP